MGHVVSQYHFTRSIGAERSGLCIVYLISSCCARNLGTLLCVAQESKIMLQICI